MIPLDAGKGKLILGELGVAVQKDAKEMGPFISFDLHGGC
jgi:hypothetical protein